jgi:hypothetical protein
VSLDRGARGEAELPDQAGRVDHPAVDEEVDLVHPDLLDAEIAEQGGTGGEGRFGQWQRDPAGPADGLGEHQHTGSGDVEGARVVLGHGTVQDLQRVLDMDELQPGVPAEHGGDHRLGEVAGQRRLGGRAEHGGEAQDGRRDLGSAAAESPDVSLDVEDVAGERATRHGARLGVLGEDRRVAERGAVRGGGRAHHQLAQPGRTLGGRQHLHGADDVLLFHRRTAAMFGVGHAGHGQVHDRFGAEVGDGLGGRTRVGPDPLDPVEQALEACRRVVRIQTDDAVDARIRGETCGHPSAEISADSGDHDNAGR